MFAHTLANIKLLSLFKMKFIAPLSAGASTASWFNVLRFNLSKDTEIIDKTAP